MRRLFTLLAMALTCALALPQGSRANNRGKIYKITFVGRGESQTADLVSVENLSNGAQLTIRGQDTLYLLHPVEYALGVENVEPVSEGDLRIADGNLVVSTPAPTHVTIGIYTLSGQLIHQENLSTLFQSATVALPSLGRGIYVVRAMAPGLNKSVKWMCDGRYNLSAANLVAAPAGEEASTTGDFAEKRQITNKAVAESLPMDKPATMSSLDDARLQGKMLQYTEGDVLRFTATSGKMRTITMNTPRSSHPVYFDFYPCEDADGNNYTIVRMGDQLWMAEDLRVKRVDGATMIADLAAWRKETGTPAWVYVKDDGDVYYTKAAAQKALPEGWSLPTQGEVDYLVKKLGGYAVAGKALKARGDAWPTQASGVDSISANFVPHGDLHDGVLNSPTQAHYLLRSTRNLMPTSLVIEDGKDAASVMTHVDNSVGFHVRGMRSAPSAYEPMLKHMGLVPRQLPRRIKGESTGPLGDVYTMKAGMQSVAFDFGGGQYKSADLEKRSGILSCRAQNGYDPADFDFHHNGFAEQTDKNTLRKMAAMTAPGGRQYVVEAKWSRPMRLWTQIVNGKYKRTDTPDVFGWGSVTLEFYGDSTRNYGQVKKVTLPDSYNYVALAKNRLKYFLYADENRTTESRIDYVQRHFQLLTADFNEDGVDDIVINVNGYVYIYDGAKLLNGQESEARMWGRVFKAEDADIPVRIAVGDVNNDGVADIAVMKTTASDCWVRIYENGNLRTSAMASVKLADSNNTWFTDVKIGRVTNSAYPEIVTLRRDFSGTTIAKKATMNIFRYNPRATNGIEQVAMDGNNVASFRGYDGHMGNNNITLAYLRGQSNPCDIIVGADLWAWDASRGKVHFIEQVLSFVDDSHWSILADHIIAADVKGTGQDGLYYFASWNTFDRNASRYNLTCMNDAWFEPGDNFDKEHKYTVTRQTYYDDKYFHYGKNGTRWENKGQLNQVELMWWFGGGDAEWCNSAALCAVNDRSVSKRLKFKSRQMAFSEPRIYAMLAAPPSFAYGEGEQDPGYDSGTTWGYTSSSSTETLKSSSISSSAIFGFEMEINAPITGQKIAGTDFTSKMQQECTSSTSSSQTIGYSQQFVAKDDDRVVMQVSPYTVYTYEVIQADNPDEVGGDFIIATPGEPRTIGLAVSDYEWYVADAPGVPNISHVFTHTIGDPRSYPSSGKDIVMASSPVMWGNGKEDNWVTTGSGGFVTREITLDNQKSQSAGFTFGMETELVVTVGCVKAGAGYGYNNTNEITHSEGTGFVVAGCVPGLAPGDRNPNRYYFDWNLCWYKYKIGGQVFPVVNYIVRPM